MNEKKQTKKALIMSVTSMVLCVAMLVGMTFAWFTDTASTAVNKIQAGNLDVKLMYSNDMITWQEATEETKLLSENNSLWEPGHTDVVYLKVVNAGNLALKYEIRTNNYNRGDRGKNADGKYFYLDKYLKIGLVETQNAFANRAEALNAAANNEYAMAKKMQLTRGWNTLSAGEESEPMGMIVYMPTTVGNEANNVWEGHQPTFKDLGILVNAIQASVESDSFGTDYDVVAPTTIDRIQVGSGTKIIENESILADGGYGAVEVVNGIVTLNNTNITAKESNMGQGTRALAVYAQKDSKVIINGGNYEQITTGDSSQYELIYALDNAEIVINDGTFKCVTPKWTLNCLDSSNAKITVNGGRFYQFNPATDNPGEVTLGAGHSVTQEGDWYVVK